MLKVKIDGQIEVATFTGTASHIAVVDQAGKRYALLQNSGTGALSAWSGDVNENSVPCEVVGTFLTVPHDMKCQNTGCSFYRIDGFSFRGSFDANGDFLTHDGRHAARKADNPGHPQFAA